MTLVLIIGIVFWGLYKYGDKFKVPSLLWKAIGVFLLIMLVRNISDVYDLVVVQADQWWPIVKENANDLANGLLGFFKHMKAGD
ncbi:MULTISPECIES: hypothetical protein [Paenibacillus]|uniref:Holin n=1 Tax=Paenibacillus odorifer TaxID=189426 RepID=A0AB36J557_9BACL|nr:hypothetical protein [Paenibacillus odorifer]OMD10586.1 hypothetical protein BJP50_28125 [Paenibacillus odorifer]OME05786.1 hypothetical protein BSK60_33075 [Paenibacillus odorifer]OME10246.1 hypothetical protein BSK47_30975 [Paenibacillus odorifer]